MADNIILGKIDRNRAGHTVAENSFRTLGNEYAVTFFASPQRFLRLLLLRDIPQDAGNAVDSGTAFDGEIRRPQIPLARRGILILQFVLHHFACKTFIHLWLDDCLENILVHYFRDGMANDLFWWQS